MSSNSFPGHGVQSAELLRKGVVIGIAGGLAEVVVVLLYGAVGDASATRVAREVASVVGLDGNSAWIGLAVHMALAAVLGIAVTCAWSLARGNSARALQLHAFMWLTLAVVWAINFFIVLPALSPTFGTLLPYSVTLLSKLMFGWTAAVTLRALSRPRMHAHIVDAADGYPPGAAIPE